MDASQRRELNKGLDDGFTQAFELVLTPAILGFLGHLIDRALGTVPVFAVLLSLFAICAVSVKIYYGYVAHMRQHEEGRPWARSR